jgi:hypothetical protein
MTMRPTCREGREGREDGVATAEILKLESELEDWLFLVPTSQDANTLARMGPIGLNVAAYHAPRRQMRGKRVIVCAPDSDAGSLEAEEVAAACRKAKAEQVRYWTLPGLHSEHATLAAWCEQFDFFKVLAFDRPWQMPAFETRAHDQALAKEVETHTQTLMRVAEQVRLFATPGGDPYVSIPVNGHVEHYRADSEAVRRWLAYAYWQDRKAPPPADAIRTVQEILAARACFGAPVAETYLRVAPDPEGPRGSPEFYLDLGRGGRAVAVSPLGWRRVDNPPVHFRRPPGIAELPDPQPGHDLEELWSIVNVESPEIRRLLTAALTYWLQPLGPYPVLVITGEQGSAKSTTTRLLKHCIDPCRPLLGSQPESVRDLMVIANTTWVITFDNISRLPSWFSDALARLATGGGFVVRRNYTDDAAQIFDVNRPLILNGIEEFAHRADLLSRALLVSLPSISDSRRKDEREIWRAFERAHPRILGALLDIAVGAVARLPLVELAGKARMADFERWGEAMSLHLGDRPGEFSRIVRSNREQATAAVLEESPVAVALQVMQGPGGFWQGTCLELLETLRDQVPAATRDQAGWPKTPRGLSSQLRRLAPALRSVGIEVQFPDHQSRRGHGVPERLFAISWGPESPESQAPY